MITSKEAYERWEVGTIRVQNYLDKEIEKHVVDAIELGQRHTTVHIDAEEPWKRLEPTYFQKQVIAELKKLGYHVSFGFYGDKYVPQGLADDDGNGPVHQNYGYTIEW